MLHEVIAGSRGDRIRRFEHKFYGVKFGLIKLKRTTIIILIYFIAPAAPIMDIIFSIMLNILGGGCMLK